MKTDTLKPTVERDYRLWLYAAGCALALGLAAWAASEFMINALAFDQTITSYTIAVRAADG
ncbi:hypothetical protein FBR02_19515, partial [Anaerolineae bacterium CFX9]|nr:hypothetical protein [Anaerolineae bacterium CFX9]